MVVSSRDKGSVFVGPCCRVDHTRVVPLPASRSTAMLSFKENSAHGSAFQHAPANDHRAIRPWFCPNVTRYSPLRQQGHDERNGLQVKTQPCSGSRNLGGCSRARRLKARARRANDQPKRPNRSSSELGGSDPTPSPLCSAGTQ